MIFIDFELLILEKMFLFDLPRAEYSSETFNNVSRITYGLVKEIEILSGKFASLEGGPPAQKRGTTGFVTSLPNGLRV